MQTHHLQSMRNGWFIGRFEPSVLTTPLFEVALHAHPKGYRGERHFHAHATEVNCVVRGRVVANGEELGPGAIFVFEPGEVCDVTFVEDTELIVVKTPSVPGDRQVVP